MSKEEKSLFYEEKIDFSRSKNPLVILSEDSQSNSEGVEEQDSTGPLVIPNSSDCVSVLRKPIPVTQHQELPQKRNRLIQRPKQLVKQPSIPSLNLMFGNISLSVV